MARELADSRRAMRQKTRVINCFEKDLHTLYTRTEQAKWREGVRNLYLTYITKQQRRKLAASGGDQRIEGSAARLCLNAALTRSRIHDAEFARQRMFMEQTIDKLERQQAVSGELNENKLHQRNRENQVLIT